MKKIAGKELTTDWPLLVKKSATFRLPTGELSIMLLEKRESN
jgi:hypothetical protein